MQKKASKPKSRQKRITQSRSKIRLRRRTQGKELQEAGKVFDKYMERVEASRRTTVSNAQSDKPFIIQSEQMIRALSSLEKIHPEVVKAFFARWTQTQTVTRGVARFLDELRAKYHLTPAEEGILRRYIGLVARFGVALRRRPDGTFVCFGVATLRL
jgi:hypothetical protein